MTGQQVIPGCTGGDYFMTWCTNTHPVPMPEKVDVPDLPRQWWNPQYYKTHRPELGLYPKYPSAACVGPLFERLSDSNIIIERFLFMGKTRFKLKATTIQSWDRLEFPLGQTIMSLFKVYHTKLSRDFTSNGTPWPYLFKYKEDHKTEKAALWAACNSRSAFLILICRIMYLINACKDKQAASNIQYNSWQGVVCTEALGAIWPVWWQNMCKTCKDHLHCSLDIWSLNMEANIIYVFRSVCREER